MVTDVAPAPKPRLRKLRRVSRKLPAVDSKAAKIESADNNTSNGQDSQRDGLVKHQLPASQASKPDNGAAGDKLENADSSNGQPSSSRVIERPSEPRRDLYSSAVSGVSFSDSNAPVGRYSAEEIAELSHDIDDLLRPARPPANGTVLPGNGREQRRNGTSDLGLQPNQLSNSVTTLDEDSDVVPVAGLNQVSTSGDPGLINGTEVAFHQPDLDVSDRRERRAIPQQPPRNVRLQQDSSPVQAKTSTSDMGPASADTPTQHEMVGDTSNDIVGLAADQEEVDLQHFSADELFSLMQSTTVTAESQAFEVSPGREQRPVERPAPVERARGNVRQQLSSPAQVVPSTADEKDAAAVLSSTPTNHGALGDTATEMSFLPPQPGYHPPAVMPPIQQPMVVQAPVPVLMPPTPVVETTPPNLVTDNSSTEIEAAKPIPETKLPEPSAIEAPKTVAPTADAPAEPDVVEEDKSTEAAESTKANEIQRIRKERELAEKRLASAVSRSKKDLYLIKDPLPEKQPRKITKLIAELEANTKPDAAAVLIRRLGSTRSAAVIGPLRDYCEGKADSTRVAVIQAMTQIPDAASSIMLLDQLMENSGDIVQEAIRSLVFLRREESLYPLIAIALKDIAHRTVLHDAMLAEDEPIQAEFAEKLTKLLNSKDVDVAVVALGLVSKLHGENQLKLYSRLLSRKSEKLRAAAIDAMVQSGEKQSVRHLNAAMKDESTLVRAAAANGLATVHSPRSSGLLLEGLLDEEVRVRRNCAKSLTQFDDQEISRGVAVALKQETDPVTIEYLLQSLGKSGSPEAVTILKKYLNSGDKELCHRALTILRRLRDRTASPLVVPFIDDNDEDTRRQAVETLGLLHDTAPVPELIRVLKKDQSPAVQAAAARALGELNDDTAVPALEEALYEDRNIKCQAVIALGRLKSKSSIPALLAQLRDPASEVRYHACGALGQMEEVPNPELLRELLDDKDPMVQRGAKAALEKLGVKYKRGQMGHKLRRLASSLVPARLAGGLPLAASTIAILIIGLLGYGGYVVSTTGVPGFATPTYRISDVQYVSVSTDGKFATVARKFRVLETWDLMSGAIVHRMELAAQAAGVVYPGKTSVFVIEGAEVKILDAVSEATADSLKDSGLKVATHRVAFTADGSLAAFCSANGSGKIVDLKTNKETGKPFTIPKFHPDSELAITNDGSLLLVGAPDGVIAVIDLSNGSKIGEVALSKILKSGNVTLASLTLNPASSVLAVGTKQGVVLAFDLNGGMKLLGQPHEGKAGIIRLAFMGENLVYSDLSGKFGICEADFSSARPLSSAFEQSPETVVFSADGKVAVANFNESKSFAAIDISGDKTLLDMKKTAE